MKIIAILCLFSGLSFSQSFKTFVMDMKYFSCKYPSNWKVERDKEKDVKSGIYKVVFINSNDNKNIVTIKYYSSKSGKDYKSFIETQSTTSDGTKESDIEKYEDVKNIKLNERKAFEINRKLKEFESVEMKSNSYWLKERIIVIPAKKGFYALTFSSKEENFEGYKELFESILKSFKPLY